ncbi:MAG: hypothetical protein HXY25_03575 [Alphaproteobacteria bacterium]|nr:hypothetical protein [Alphaproteobacteria bacterium]
MQITLIGLLVLALWAAVAYRRPSDGLLMVVLCMPFGATAVFNLPAVGGLSLLAANTVAAVTIGLLLARHLSGPDRHMMMSLPPAALALVGFAAYGTLASILMPQIFHHAFLVFSMARDVEGGVYPIQGIRSVLVPIEANPSNFSQSAYLLLGTAYFLALVWLARLRGPGPVHRMLTVAACINLALAALDSLSLDGLLGILRTANYAILSEHAIQGVSRIIGGFPEASAFGGYTAALYAYFASAWLDRRDPRLGLLALGSGAGAIMALSSTAYVSLTVVTAVLLARTLVEALASGVRVSRLLTAILGGLAVLALITLLLLLTPLGAAADGLLDELIFNKAESRSGIERGAWAAWGLKAFVETYGLGAGLGSLRSNGLMPVLLSNVGLPGTVCYAAFVWFAFLRRPPGLLSPEMRMLRRAASTGALSLFTAQFLSATTPDPGLALLTYAAIATASARMGVPVAAAAPLTPPRGDGRLAARPARTTGG